MKGDFTRSTFRPEKHYTSVRLQQGRVQLDADWNEQVDIQRYQQQAMQAAFLGTAGAPKVGGGFAITTTPASGSPDLAISPGRFYVNGLLCELPAGVTYSTQPDYPGAPKLSTLAAGTYIVYLDVWTRHVTSLEDPLLREVALAGPDTTTRTQTVAQVKLLKIPAAIGVLDPIDLSTYIPTSNLRLAARAFSASGQPGTLAPPGSGYLRLDNHLYRVEIHQGGKLGTDPVTYKWSRENGSVLTPWIDGSGSTLTVGPIGHEEERGFAVGGWVEITDDGRELRGEPGVLTEVTSFEGSSLTVKATVNRSDFPQNPRIRRWEMIASTIPALTAAQANGTTWIPLEDGVQIAFTGDTCRTGDYWIIPARTATRDVEWPQKAGAPAFVLRHGEVHTLVDLAQVEWTGAAFVANKTLDRRYVFSPLVDFRTYDPQTWETRITTHKHTGDVEGSQIPRGGIVNNAIDGTKIDPASVVTISALTVKGNTKQTGVDLSIDSRSNVTDGSNRRALSHDAASDTLTLNTGGDYSGGVRIGGSKIEAFSSQPLRFATTWSTSLQTEPNASVLVNDMGTYKMLMILGNRAGVSNGPRKVGIWDNLEVNGTIVAASSYKQGGTDLQIDNKTNRGTATGATRRALVHETGDTLTINSGADYTGGVKVASALAVDSDVVVGNRLTLKGTDFYLDNTARRGGRGGDSRRALVHNNNDLLTVNFGNDYTSGVSIVGQLSLGDRTALNNNTVFLRGFTDGNHGLGHFGDTDRYFAGKTIDGPALYGNGGGILGSAQLPNSAIEGAAHFSSSGYVDLPNMNDDFSNGFTLEVWVWWDYKTGTTMPKWSRVIDFSLGGTAATGADSILLANSGTTQTLVFQIKDTSGSNLWTITAADAIETGKWMHLCVTITDSTAVMYKNGSPLTITTSGTVAVPAKKNRQNNFIGKSAFSDDLFCGRVSNVRLWKRALDANEVSDSVNNTRPTDTKGLLGWWRLSDGSCRDYSGLKRNGSFQGGNADNYLATYQNAALTWDRNNNVEVTGRLTSGNNKSISSNAVTIVQFAHTSWVDLEGLSQTVTFSTAATVLILVNVGAVQSQLADQVRGQFRIVLVSGSKTTELARTAHEFQSGGWSLRDVMMHTMQSLAAGTHTIKVQWIREGAATGQLGCGWYNATRSLSIIELA